MLAVGTEELLWAGADAQARALAAGELTAPELLAAVLRRIDAVQPAINAFRVVCAEQAERDAAQAQRRLAAGERAPLLGVPVAVKDDTDVAGITTCQGADPAPQRPAARDSEVVGRLRAAGAVVVGKTNVPELTIWPFTESLHHGATRNPWALDRAPGGSSGGSAAAVAAGVVGLAHGSDGAGSIRIPASWCAVVGLKPTRGLVPTAPVAHDWYRMVHYGPLARDVASAARYLDACAPAGDGAQGYLDALAQPLPPLRVAVSRHSPPGSLPALRRVERAAFERAAALLSDAGHDLRELDPSVPATAAAQVLGRYLRGIRDTARGVPPGSRLEPRTRGMARLGGLVPPRLLRASLRGEPALAHRVLAIFDEVDVVLQPGPSSPPSVIGEYASAGALRTLGAAIMKVPFLPLWNLVGNPVLAAPVMGGRAVTPDGDQSAGGAAAGAQAADLPAGVQLVGPPGSERTLLRLALQLEQATGWATRRPAALPH